MKNIALLQMATGNVLSVDVADEVPSRDVREYRAQRRNRDRDRDGVPDRQNRYPGGVHRA